MKTFLTKTHRICFVLLGIVLFASGFFIKTSHHLAPQSIFIGENVSVNKVEALFSVDKYLADLEDLRDNLARGEKQKIAQIIKTLPVNFRAYQFAGPEKIKELIKTIVDAQDYSIDKNVNNSVIFKNYIAWLESAFPDIFSIIAENDMDFSTEAILQVVTLLTENVLQHGGGECILIIGKAGTQHYFSLVSKGEFKSVKGAMINQREEGAVRGENSGEGVALSEALDWYLSELNDFLSTYYADKGKQNFDVLITGRDGKFSYKGWLADSGYSPHQENKGGATATFALGKNNINALKDFWNLIINSEDDFLAAA